MRSRKPIGKKAYRVKRRGAVHLTFAESDERAGVEYEIAKLPDGNFACACMGFVFDKHVPKTCKHISAYAGVEPTGAFEGGTFSDAVVAQVAHETFTFRRAISFGGAL